MIRESPARLIADPRELALHTFCKQMLRSRLFKGFYKERCYIDKVKGYRDLIIVDRSEKDIIAILEDIERKLRDFYASKTSMWVGITTTQSALSDTAFDTCLWVELDELAFDLYWLSVKSVRLRDNEIIIKLKPIRPVEIEPVTSYSSVLSHESLKAPDSLSILDFTKLMANWGTSIKRTLYEFMSNDVSKENLKGLFKFLILICISLLSASVEAIRFVGIFTIRFIMEFRKLLAVATPIIMRLIDLSGKIIGGLYILLAMIWRDVKGGRGPPQQLNQPRAIAYDRPIYQRIKNERMSQKSICN